MVFLFIYTIVRALCIYLILILALALFPLQLNGQGNQLITVAEIEFVGAKRTHTNFLLHCIAIEGGDNVSQEQIEKATQNILNSNFFSSAYCSVFHKEQSSKLTFYVEEKHTILPSFKGGFSKENTWFEAGAIDFHFLGQGVKLGAFYRYNQRSGFLGYIIFPYIRGTKWGADIYGENALTVEPVYFDNDTPRNFNLQRVNAIVLATQELKRFKQSFQFGFAWLKETYEFSEFETSVEYHQFPIKELQNRFLGVIKYKDESRLNQFEQYQYGYSYEASVEHILLNMDNRNFARLTLEGKYYLRIGGRGNLATRAKVTIAENNTSKFAPLYFDNFMNLRGIGYIAKRGTAEFTLNIEHRQTLFNRSWVAVQGVTFTDYSGLRSPGGELFEVIQNEHNQIFAGLGGRINFKQITGFILRFDYGFSLKDETRGFVFGVNHYF